MLVCQTYCVVINSFVMMSSILWVVWFKQSWIIVHCYCVRAVLLNAIKNSLDDLNREKNVRIQPKAAVTSLKMGYSNNPFLSRLLQGPHYCMYNFQFMLRFVVFECIATGDRLVFGFK